MTECPGWSSGGTGGFRIARISNLWWCAVNLDMQLRVWYYALWVTPDHQLIRDMHWQLTACSTCTAGWHKIFPRDNLIISHCSGLFAGRRQALILDLCTTSVQMCGGSDLTQSPLYWSVGFHQNQIPKCQRHWSMIKLSMFEDTFQRAGMTILCSVALTHACPRC